MSHGTIGILGGMGPRATVYFEQRLLEKFEGPDQSLPKLIVINDGSTPDRTAFLCHNGADPLPTLLSNALALQRFEPDIVCIPCNTAHAEPILGRLRTELALPVLDMPAAALQSAFSCDYKNILVLGTEGTRASRVYDARAGRATVRYPERRQQAAVSRLITDTKQRGYTDSNRNVLAAIIGLTDCDAAILACTELSMLNRDLSPSVPVIDALEVLADQCADRLRESYTIGM